MIGLNVEVVGYVGTGLLSIVLVPQLHKCYTEKCADSISPWFVMLQALTSVVFIVYGMGIKAMPIIASNGIIVVNCAVLGGMKYRYGHSRDGFNKI